MQSLIVWMAGTIKTHDCVANKRNHMIFCVYFVPSHDCDTLAFPAQTNVCPAGNAGVVSSLSLHLHSVVRLG